MNEHTHTRQKLKNRHETTDTQPVRIQTNTPSVFMKINMAKGVDFHLHLLSGTHTFILAVFSLLVCVCV